MIDKVKYWVDISDYDLETAEAMLETGRLLYVGFMCHQSIEKIFKAYFEKEHTETPPYTHNLNYLLSKIELKDIINKEQKGLLSMLEPLNIKSRYPDYREKIAKSLSKEYCHNLITDTKNLQSWVKTKL